MQLRPAQPEARGPRRGSAVRGHRARPRTSTGNVALTVCWLGKTGALTDVRDRARERAEPHSECVSGALIPAQLLAPAGKREEAPDGDPVLLGRSPAPPADTRPGQRAGAVSASRQRAPSTHVGAHGFFMHMISCRPAPRSRLCAQGDRREGLWC